MMQHYRNRLAMVWLGWSGVLVLFLAWRLMIGDGTADTIIGWLSPQVVPTLALVCGVSALAQPAEAAGADAALRAPYLRAMVASVLYLLVVTAATCAAVLTYDAADTTLAPFGGLLGLLQGVTAATLGIFFVKAPAKD